jgi:hypothetical protein
VAGSYFRSLEKERGEESNIAIRRIAMTNRRRSIGNPPEQLRTEQH